MGPIYTNLFGDVIKIPTINYIEDVGGQIVSIAEEGQRGMMGVGGGYTTFSVLRYLSDDAAILYHLDKKSTGS
jgi:hypothetical protein